MSVAIRVLGAIDVIRGGRSTSVGGQVAKGILSVLLVRAGLTVSADRLLDDVWRDRARPSMKRSLQAHISNLRKAVGRETIVAEGGGYRLDLQAVSLDAADFERRSALGGERLRLGDPEGAERHLSTALDLWRGGAYADVQHLDAVREEIDRLEQLRVHATEQRSRARSELDPESAIPDLVSLFDRNPDRESVAALLMTTLYRVGRQAEALDVYAAIRARLVDTKGISPSPALQHLELRILNQDPTLDTKRTLRLTNIPLEPRPLIGRDREVAATIEHLRSARFTTLVGDGGLGKTAIARVAAGRLIEEFPGGVWWVDLESVRDARLAAQAVATTVPAAGDGPPLEIVRRRLQVRPSLLVLDGIEPNLNADHDFLEWVASCGAAVLATSRLPVGQENAVITVEPLAVPGPDAPDERIDEFDGVKLFLARARAANAAATPLESDPAAVAAIVRSTGGNPLEIELAAANLRTRELSELGRRTADTSTLLWGRHIDAPDEAALVLLSGVAGSFGDQVARALLGEAASEDLSRLERIGALHLVHSRGGGPRYRLADSIRLTAAGRLQQSEQQAVFADRITRWAAAAVPEHAVRSDSAGLRAALTTLVEGGDTLRAAEIGGRVAAAWITTTAALGEGRVWLRRIAEMGLPAGTDTADIWYWLGRAEFRIGDFPEALRALERSAQVARTADEPRTEARALVEIGHVHQFIDPERGDAEVRRAGGAARAHGDTEIAARADLYLGQSMLLSGRSTTAAADLLAAASVTFRELERIDALAHCEAMRAAALHVEGETALALDVADEALTLAEEGPDRSIELLALYRLAVLEHLAGRAARSRRTARRGLRMALEIGHRALTAALLLAFAAIEQEAGNLAGAVDCLGGFDAIRRELGLAENAIDRSMVLDRLRSDLSPPPAGLDGFEVARRLAG